MLHLELERAVSYTFIVFPFCQTLGSHPSKAAGLLLINYMLFYTTLRLTLKIAGK